MHDLLKRRVKRWLLVGITIGTLCAVAAEAQVPRPVLENQLFLIQQAIRLNQQRQDDYKMRSVAVPDFLTKQRADLESQRSRIEQQLKQ